VLRFLKTLLLLPVAVVVVLLAVANRGPVILSLDPFSRTAPEISVSVPLYIVIFAAIALGMLIGGVGAWLAQAKHRRARRLYGREVSRLRSEAERLRTSPAPQAQALPAPSRNLA
jgi:transposase